MNTLQSTNTRIKTKPRQHGMAAVEFAIVLPVLLLLMLATAELGRAFYQYNTLTKTTRDGARYLANNAIEGTTELINMDQPGLIDETRNLVVYGSTTNTTGPRVLGGLNVTNIIPSEVLDADGNTTLHVRVSSSYTYVPILPGISIFGLGGGITFQTSTTMRAL